MEAVPFSPLIRTPDQRLRVFVSSTLQELAEERRAASQAILQLKLAPVLFELGARPYPPRDLYRAYLEQSHIFIGIYWQRYGWIAPGMDISGLEDEYRLAQDKPKLIYIKRPLGAREARLEELLERIRNDDRASYRLFETADELRELIENDLAILLTERFEATEPKLPSAGRLASSAALPVPPTPLIGRQKELAALRQLILRDKVRLVTLCGPGGVGKSRLALELAMSLKDAFKDGVHLVRLANLSDSGLLAPTIAHALGLNESAGKSVLESLKEFLKDKQMLLLLDNFEQLLGAATIVSQLLAAAAKLEVVVTSRASLRLSGEHEFALEPLPLPERDHMPVQALGEVEAVRLFVERAQAVKPDFALNPQNASAVAVICRALDGLPLAIELAAARVRLLSPQALLARMNKRLPLLTGGARDLPERQRTLYSTIDWSYKLLTSEEQALFAQLAVFAGGFRLEDAEAICETSGLDKIEGLMSLVDKSLVRLRDIDGAARFSMFATIREYALEMFAALREQDAIRRAHARHYLELAERAVPELRSGQQGQWLVRLETEHDNLRAAFSYYLERQEVLAALRLGIALRWFWMMRGHFAEGRRWLEAALELKGEVGPDVRAAALNAAGVLAWRQGDLAAAQPLLEASLELQQALGNTQGMASSYRNLGLLRHNQGDYAEARRFHERSLSLSRELGDELGVANTLLSLGNVALDQGDEAAGALYEESRALFGKLGDKLGAVYALDNLGVVAWYENRLETARLLSQEALERYEALGSKLGCANVSHRLGLLAYSQGDYPEAWRRYQESLEAKRELGDARGVAFLLHDLARVALAKGERETGARFLAECLAVSVRLGAKPIVVLGLEAAASFELAQDRPELAARLLSAAAAARQAIAVPVAPVNAAALEREVAQVRARLGEAAFQAAWQEGQQLSLEEASAFALARGQS